MLKLSTRGLYGIKALYELANNFGKKPVNIRAMSERHGMPVPFLEQVLYLLKKRGLVISKRGINGGYMLARPPEEITIGDAVRALEGPIALCDCLVKTKGGKVSVKAKNCIASGLYRKLGEKVEQAFDSITLLELSEENAEKTFSGKCHTF
ncbi:Rrf2 family transcriptional regulator [bacterium]|nr:Rrf2 family transcriptional regulator [bacterium]